MDPKEVFAKTIAQGTACVKHASDEQLGNATPCTEWDLKALLNHMVYELLWIPDILQGKTVAEVGDRHDGDILHSDFHGSWGRAADAALMAVKHADLDETVHLSYADVPAKHYILEAAGDILIHTWDMAQAIHCNLMLDQELVQAVYDNLKPRQAELTGSGLFAKPINVPDSADIQTKLLALVGRQIPKVA